MKFNPYHFIKGMCLLVLMNIGLVGCATTEIEIKEPKAIPVKSDYTKLAILPLFYSPPDFTECLELGLNNELRYLEFTSEEIFRDAIFPWFESTTKPESLDELLSLIEHPDIKQRIKNLGVQLLISVSGRTHGSLDAAAGVGFLSYAGGGVFGYMSMNRETNVTTTIIDLEKTSSLGGTQIWAEGTLAIPMFFLPLPIPVGYATGTSACNQTVQHIVNSLISMSQHN